MLLYGQQASVTVNPVTGQYFVQLNRSDVVEVVVQNNPGNSTSESASAKATL